MNTDRVEVHEGTSGFAYIRDARIVAFRWDLLESGLVLDMDAPTSESQEAQYMRAWVVFDAVSNLSVPAMNRVRVTKGFWSGTELRRDSVGAGEHKFVLSVLLPRFTGDILSESPQREITMVAARALVLTSRRTGRSNSGVAGLDNRQRAELATEADQLQALSMTWE